MKRMKSLYFAAFILLLPLNASSETLTYNYDPAGRLIETTLNYGVGITYVYDDTGNRLDRIVAIADPADGDINNDGVITLDDAVLSLQLLSGIEPETPIFKDSDINSNSRIDLAETIWVLRSVAELQ